MPRATTPRSPNDADAYIATRLRAARLQSGLSQEAAGTALGVSFQQIQKYEKGVNRLSVGKLFGLGKLYRVPLTWFFDGLNEAQTAGFSDVSAQLLASPHGADLARDFIAISNPAGRAAVLSAAAAFASAEAA